jgi:hypothetical protein
MGLSYEDRQALRVLRSRIQQRRFPRWSRMTSTANCGRSTPRALRLGALADGAPRQSTENSQNEQ